MMRWTGRSTSAPAAVPQARRRCDLAFVMAVADGEWLGIEELLDSLQAYLQCDYQMVVMDDITTDGTYEKLRQRGIWVARNTAKHGLYGLDRTIRHGLHNAWRLFDAPVYVKIDPDALLIGHGLREALLDAFSANPRGGIAGTYTVDWNGEPRDLSYWRERFERVGKDFGAPLRTALENGYPLGNGVQGGCYAIRSECVEAMAARGYLDRWDHPNTAKGKQVAEDSILTMLAYAAGFEGIDIGGPGQPFGIWHVGLPMPPEELVRQGRIVTHAMKYADEVSLAARAFFRDRRLRDTQPKRA